MVLTKGRLILGVLAVFLLIFFCRFLTVRSGDCRPQPVDPHLRLLTRDEGGTQVSFPERTGFPPQHRPLVVMTYNIAGHDELIHGDHVQKIAEAIRRLNPDIVALQEVNRNTWESRFHDQLAEIEARTGLHGYFAPSYRQGSGSFGNAILTRGEILEAEAHPLPSRGEPRMLLEATVRIDGATINVFATHLSTWGRFNAKIRTEQLHCLAQRVRASRHPFILAGDFNTHPEAPEMEAFRGEHAAQLASQGIGTTFPLWKQQIDYIFTDYGWETRVSRAWPIGTSDHLPVTAELMWERKGAQGATATERSQPPS